MQISKVMPAYVACVREELWDSDRRPNVGLTEITQDGSPEFTNYSDDIPNQGKMGI